MTKEERKIWFEFLRDLSVKVYRQKIIGNYIVDFFCPKANTVIEIDGSQHFEDEGIESDMLRDKYLNSLGITVLRYNNREINTEFERVCLDIKIKLGLLQ